MLNACDRCQTANEPNSVNFTVKVDQSLIPTPSFPFKKKHPYSRSSYSPAPHCCGDVRRTVGDISAKVDVVYDMVVETSESEDGEDDDGDYSGDDATLVDDEDVGYARV